MANGIYCNKWSQRFNFNFWTKLSAFNFKLLALQKAWLHIPPQWWAEKNKPFSLHHIKQHGSHCISLSTSPYHQSVTILPNYILCPYRANVNKFLLVSQHWHVHAEGSKLHLWVRPGFFRSFLHILFVLLGWFVEMGRNWLYRCCFLR